MTRLIKEAEHIILEVPESEETIDCLQVLSGAIKVKGKLLESLNEKILSKVKIEEIENQINESAFIDERIIEVRRKISHLLKKTVSKSTLETNTSELWSQSVENTEQQSDISVGNVQETIVGGTNTQVVTNTQLQTHLQISEGLNKRPLQLKCINHNKAR